MADGKACAMTKSGRDAGRHAAASHPVKGTTPVVLGAAGHAAGWRFLRFLGSAPSRLAGVVLFLLMVMTFFDVVLRSAINNPIESATELTRLALAIIVFASLPAVSYKGEHIIVDLMEGVMGPRIRRVLDLLVNVACGILLLWPAWRVWQLAMRARAYGDMTEYLHIPQVYISVFIAVMTFAAAVAFIARGLVLFFRPGLIHPYRSPDNPVYAPDGD